MMYMIDKYKISNYGLLADSVSSGIHGGIANQVKNPKELENSNAVVPLFLTEPLAAATGGVLMAGGTLIAKTAKKGLLNFKLKPVRS